MLYIVLYDIQCMIDNYIMGLLYTYHSGLRENSIHGKYVGNILEKKSILVVRWATRPPNLVAQYLFLVVPGVRTPDLSSPAGPYLSILHITYKGTLYNH